jgi:hypothetical protein
MTSDYSSRKIPVFTGVNNVPNTPSSTVAPNGSYLIAKYNSLVDDLQLAINNLQAANSSLTENLNALNIPGIASSITSLNAQVSAIQSQQSTFSIQLGSTQTQQATLVNQITALQQQIADIQEAIDALQPSDPPDNTPATDPFFDDVVLLLSNGADVKNHTLTLTAGATVDTENTHFGLPTFYLPGNEACLTIPASPSEFGFVGDFTMEWWLKLDILPTSGGEDRSADKYVNLMTAGTVDSFPFDVESFNIALNPVPPYSSVFYLASSLGNLSSDESFTPTSDWQFYSITRKNNRLFLHVDGILQGAITVTGSALTANSDLRFGCNVNGTDSAVGHFGEIRCTLQARHEEQPYTVPATAFAKQ